MPHTGKLHDKLEEAIRLVVSKKRLGSPGMSATALFSGLHQALTGPARSGKTFQAMEYARALAEEGLVSSSSPVIIEGAHLHDPLYRADIAPILRDPGRRAVIIDEVDKIGSSIAPLLAGELARLIDGKDAVVILTGPEREMDEFLRNNPPLAARLPLPLSLVRPPEPTPEEIAERRRQSIISEWQGMKAIAVHAGKPLKTPGIARFTKKDPARTS